MTPGGMNGFPVGVPEHIKLAFEAARDGGDPSKVFEALDKEREQKAAQLDQHAAAIKEKLDAMERKERDERMVELATRIKLRIGDLALKDDEAHETHCGLWRRVGEIVDEECAK